MIDDYWPMAQTMPGTLISTSQFVEYYSGLASGEPSYSPDYPKGSPNPNGDITWGSEVDGNFVRLNYYSYNITGTGYNATGGVWDLGSAFSEVAVFPYVDGSSLANGLDFWIWGSNDFDICNPDAATWARADLDRIYRKGWTDAGEDTYTICNDDFVSVWDWKCNTGCDNEYRFIKVQSLCNTKFVDSEIDAVKGVNPAFCNWQTTILERGNLFSYNSLAIDSDGGMHIAYGEEQLYYIVCDCDTFPCCGGICQKEEIDSGGVGAYCSLALNNSGNPAISYYDAKNGNLKVARKYGSGNWHIRKVDTEGDVGLYTSIAFDSSNNPAISYYNATNDDLKYAYWNGTSWLTETVDSQGWVGSYTSLAFDKSGNPSISYYDATNDNLKYAYKSGSSWVIKTVDSQGNVGMHTSLAFDGSGNPGISYQDVTHGYLKYAQRDGTTWVITTVDEDDYTGFYTSLAFDSSNNPAISYYESTHNDLKYAYCDGTDWYIQNVDSVGNVGLYTSLALDSSCGPIIISYYDDSNDVLKSAKWDGTKWEKTLVCSLGDAGRYTSLAFDNEYNPAISYYDLRFGDLRYEHWTGKSWEAETVDSGGDVGRYTSLAFDSFGNPAISYYDVSNGNLKYAHWNSSKWDIETVPSSTDVGSYCSLAFDPSSGNPAISYYDAANGALIYAQYNGTTWDIETLDNSSRDVGSYTSLAFNTSGGGPIIQAISYYDATHGYLKCAYRYNSSDWEIETVDSWVDSVVDVGSYTSLAFNRSGNPAISYYDATNGALKYALWSSDEWEIEVVDDSGWVGMYTSLAFEPVGNCCGAPGDPAISYYDATNGFLKYALWNSDEENWEIATVDSVGLPGRYSSLAFNPLGSPAISYDEAIHDDLRYTQIPPECGRCQPPNKPGNISPGDRGFATSKQPTLISSVFSDPNEESAHAASHWQVSTTSNDYSSPIFDSGIDTSNLTSITITQTELKQNTTYYWRVKYQDDCGFWSRWSVETFFTTHPPPYQPSNISPADGVFVGNLTPTLIASAFSNRDDDTYKASQWQVTTTAGEYFNPIFEDTNNKISITIPSGKLSYETDYYWRVRYQDAYGAWSNWSAETSFIPTDLPAISSIDPGLGIQGQTLTVTITGIHFTDDAGSGATEVSLGSLVTINNFSVDSDSQITASITIADTAIPGTSEVAVTAPDGIATLTDGFGVIGQTADVPSGSDVTVDLGSTTVIFETVDTAGTISLTNLAQNPGGALPEFDVVGFIMDITTTAVYNGPITLTVNYDESGIKRENKLRLFHWNGTVWDDLTTKVETGNNIIRGEVSTLSPFFVGKPTASSSSSGASSTASPTSNVVIYAIILIGIFIALFISILFVMRKRKIRIGSSLSAMIDNLTKPVNKPNKPSKKSSKK